VQKKVDVIQDWVNSIQELQDVIVIFFVYILQKIQLLPLKIVLLLKVTNIVHLIFIILSVMKEQQNPLHTPLTNVLEWQEHTFMLLILMKLFQILLKIQHLKVVFLILIEL
jgi:uncharacterized membrane protein